MIPWVDRTIAATVASAPLVIELDRRSLCGQARRVIVTRDAYRLVRRGYWQNGSTSARQFSDRLA